MRVAWGYCPRLFRTIDSVDYKKAMLVFYEQNNITVFKLIFIEQNEFVMKNYFLGRLQKRPTKKNFWSVSFTLCLIFYKFEFNKLPYLLL